MQCYHRHGSILTGLRGVVQLGYPGGVVHTNGHDKLPTADTLGRFRLSRCGTINQHWNTNISTRAGGRHSGYVVVSVDGSIQAHYEPRRVLNNVYSLA